VELRRFELLTSSMRTPTREYLVLFISSDVNVTD